MAAKRRPRVKEGVLNHADPPRAESMNGFRESAVAYARHGWPVFPLVPRDKKPLTPNGFHDASADTNTVSAWWNKWPNANIGVPTGQAIGSWVLDCDCKHGQPGLDTYQRLSHEPALRETLQQVTGSGGKQLFFRLPAFDVPVFRQKQTKNVGLDGCDVQGTGAYVVLPPSIHPETGSAYSWDGLDPFDRQPILDTPSVLLDALAKLINPPKVQKPDKITPEVITEGHRNDVLFRLACSLRSKGLSEAAISAAVVEENRTRCKPPLSVDEVRRIASSACRYEAGATVRVDLSLAEATVNDLNRLALFSGRIHFDKIWRRGGNTFARVHNGREMREIRWPSDSDLLSFARSQSVLMNAGVLIPSPRKGEIRPAWEAAVQLILMLAQNDRVDTGDAVLLETEEMLARTWRDAGKPTATGAMTMGHCLMWLTGYRRDPAVRDSVPPAVFVAEGSAWVHVPTWRTWMSTPAGYNRLFGVKQLHDGLAAVGFRPQERVARSVDGQRFQLDLWRGDVLPCLTAEE